MNQIKKAWKKAEGYKTKSGAILYLLFQLFKSLFPNTLNETNEEVIKHAIDLMILTGGIDWIWRNRKKVIDWAANIFKRKEK